MSYTQVLALSHQDERANEAYCFSVLPFNNKFVLQHDKIALSHLIFHQTLQARAQRVKKVSGPRLHFFRRKEPDPSESGNDPAGFKFIGELGHFLDACDEVAGNL